MSRLSFTALSLAVAAATVLGGAGAAYGASPSITKSSCQAQGGTFSQSQGSKTCTTTTVREVVTQEIVAAPQEEFIFAGVFGHYYQVYGVTYRYQDATTCTERGNKPPTCTTTTTFLDVDRNAGICQFVTDDGIYYAANRSDCESRGL